jgi:hypothetical protein
MINELIEKTNKEEFYQNDNIYLINTKSDIGELNIAEFNFIIEERDIYGNMAKSTLWKIISNRTIEFKNFHNSNLLPYVKIKIIENHPLLWNFHEDNYECVLNGFPEKPNEFIGDLHFEFENLTGNWLNLNEFIHNINEYYKKNNSTTISIPKSVKDIFEKVCLKHKVELNIENIKKNHKKGFTNRPNAKLLIFGNEDVCPNDYNLFQPYIIAESFMATKIE